LTRLFVGSEGTLGVITAITLRLYEIPEAIASAVVQFDSMEDAVNAVTATIQWGIPIARIEFVDAVQMDALNRYSKLDYALLPTLFWNFTAPTAASANRPNG
jgi:D-lactate dehydrogenase (cytochrome)